LSEKSDRPPYCVLCAMVMLLGLRDVTTRRHSYGSTYAQSCPISSAGTGSEALERLKTASSIDWPTVADDASSSALISWTRCMASQKPSLGTYVPLRAS